MTALRVWIFLTLLTGILYTGFVTLLGQQIFPHAANGSLIVREQKIMGSKLIGQNFTTPRYFHGRPSASNYDAMPSAAYNAVLSEELYWNNLKNSKPELCTDQPAADLSSMVMASGSGLDPNITIAAACGQIPRIAKARKIAPTCIDDVITKNENRKLVNVLLLNLALDESCKK